MASHDYPDRRHSRRQRPPRYSDESDTSEDEYGRARQRPTQRGARGAGVPGGPGYPIDPPPSHVRPPSPPPSHAQAASGPPPPRRGPPILVEDPTPPFPAPPPGPTPRARSNVRIKTPSDAESDGGYSRGERDRGPAARPRASRKDLERKNSTEHIQFREKRDGYLSDEGEALKKARKSRPARGDSDSEGRRGAGKSLKEKFAAALPIRSNSTRAKSMEPPPPYGADPRGAPPDDRRRPRRAEYEDDDFDRIPQRSRSHREPPRRRYDDDDDYGHDDYRERPNRAYDRRDRDRDRDRDRARDDRRKSGGGGLYPPPDPDRGYRSDQGHRRREPDYSRRDDYERDAYDRRRRDGGYRDYHSDRDDDRRRDPRRRDTYGDPRDRYGGGRDRERDRYRSSREYDDPRGGRSRGKGYNWQKDAGQLFLTYGLPYLKKEGPNLVKQAQQFWTKRQGGS